MEEQRYRLLGTVSVPEDKKEELNKYVLEVLYKGGIRKTCEVILDGKTFTMIKPAVPDENGIVQFDYSVFERKLRQVGRYDTNKCTIEVYDRGYNEYGLVMNIVMFLLEVYSENMCLLMDGDRPVSYPRGYLQLLKGLIGIEFCNDKRSKAWDMSYFLHKNGLADIKLMELIDVTIDGYLYCEQLEACIAQDDIKRKYDDKVIDIQKDKIATAKAWERKEFLYKLFQDKLAVNDDKFEADFKALLNADIVERQKIAERDDEIGIVAMCSLYMLPATIVRIYAGVKELAFWDAWETFGEQQYTDVLPDDEKTKEEKNELGIIPFYKATLRDNENEFLEYWTGDNLILTNEMQEYIDDWQKWYKEVDISTDIEMEKELSLLAEYVSSQYKATYLDYDFVMDFMQNKENKNYQRAIKLFKMTKERDCWLFPELTAKQAYEWVIRYSQSDEDKIAVRAYQALLQNKEQRMRLFGF